MAPLLARLLEVVVIHSNDPKRTNSYPIQIWLREIMLYKHQAGKWQVTTQGHCDIAILWSSRSYVANLFCEDSRSLRTTIQVTLSSITGDTERQTRCRALWQDWPWKIRVVNGYCIGMNKGGWRSRKIKSNHIWYQSKLRWVKSYSWCLGKWGGAKSLVFLFGITWGNGVGV